MCGDIFILYVWLENEVDIFSFHNADEHVMFLYIIFCQLGGGIFLQVDGIGLRLSLWLVAGAALKQFFGFEPVIGKDPLAVHEGGGKAK